MIILQANKLERSFAGDVLFENISLQINEQDRMALVGPNGAGKSTLLKILVGEESPTAGDINRKKDVRLSYLAQNSRFASDKTIYDEMLSVFSALRQDEAQLRHMESQMGLLAGQELEQLMHRYDQLLESFRQRNGFAYEAEIKAILNGFKFDASMWHMPIAELSGGQNTRLALAKMLLEKPDLLVLDEPTNHLDMETIAWLENYLVNYQGALLIVSHDRYFLDKVATITLDLNRGQLDRYQANYSQFVDLKAEKLALEAKHYDKQQKEIAKLEDFVQKNLVRASTTKRAQSRRKQLAKIERLDKPSQDSKPAHMNFEIAKPSGNVVLKVQDLAVGYAGDILASPINLEVNKQDAIAVVGPNGIGKSTLIKTIMGHLQPIAGAISYGANVEMGYYDQGQSRLTPSNTVLEELWQAFATTPEVAIRNRLGAFLFSGDDVKKSVSMLSGGEKARLLLAKLSMEKDNFLLLDEPTNHLDIESREVLEDAMITYQGTLLFVSHDRYFINRIATKVLELSKEGATLYLGDYDYYLEKKAELAELTQLKAMDQPQTAEPEQAPTDYHLQKEKQKEERKRQRQMLELEQQLEAIETELVALNQAMLATNNTAELIAAQEQLTQLTQKQDQLMEEWANLDTSTS
ncbi:ABC-F family ATP-binding cassette domain-containing protein [Streptococcus halichoeri]|uniref:ABC-F family ATP-binding cassette domain-containing protein n=1 Tax=Streptococcus halichoeri TaxID=254785 RepID=UPI00135BC5B8|nr:ABC-F family ATP-binding cassette domain-containing protein [Streptococcus halichoeri]